MQCVLGIAGKVVLSEAKDWLVGPGRQVWLHWGKRLGFWCRWVGGGAALETADSRYPSCKLREGFAWSQNSLIFPKIGTMKRCTPSIQNRREMMGLLHLALLSMDLKDGYQIGVGSGRGVLLASWLKSPKFKNYSRCKISPVISVFGFSSHINCFLVNTSTCCISVFRKAKRRHLPRWYIWQQRSKHLKVIGFIFSTVFFLSTDSYL